MSTFFKTLWTTYFILAFCLSAVVVAAPPPEKLVIGVESTAYFPHYDHDDRNEYIGFARSILDEFGKASGRQVAYVIVPIKRLFNDFLDGKVDFKYPDNALWQGDLKKGFNIIYSDPVVGYIDGAMVAKDMVGKPIDRLKNLGTVRGFTPYDYLPQIQSGQLKVNENNTFTGLLEMGIAGRVDAAYINIDVAKYQLKERLRKTGALEFDPGLPHSKESYRLSSIKFPEVIKEFNEFMAKNKTLIEEIKKKYDLN